MGGSMQWRRVRGLASALVAVAAMTACGGGGDGGATPSGGSGLVASSTVADRCVSPRGANVLDENGNPYADVQGTLADEKSWLRSWTDETYLWYADVRGLPAATLDPTVYPTAVDYFDVLRSPVITASGKPKDAYHFTYDTPTWINLSQSAVSIGYGFETALLASTPPRSAVVAYAVPATPAAAQGLARGAQILAVDGVDLVNDNTSAGIATLNAGLFPTAPGTHTLTVLDLGTSAPRNVTLVASALTEQTVQNVKMLPAPNQSVGYLQFNDHLATSEAELVAAFRQLQAAGATDLVLDIRYNGGGYLDIASELAYMVAGPARTTGRVFEQEAFNDRNPFQLTAAQTITPFFATAQGLSVASGTALPTLGLARVYLLVGAGTCSASEAIANGLRGVGVTVDLIGATTCGKPYGFFPQDNCGTTYFAIQFRGVNALGQGDYADGLAPTCSASDDFTHALGDPAEGRLAGALTYRATGVCAPPMARAQSVSGRSADVEPTLVRSPLRSNRWLRPRQGPAG